MKEPQKYQVQGFPTLVVVDPQGKIAEFHVGYSSTLRAEIGAVIRHLLPADTKAALTAPKAN
jgi:protein-disulfide isomerase-like protein with CxxC motif